MKYDLAWGNSVAVREAFLKTYNQIPLIFSAGSMMRFDYPTHCGDPKLVEMTRAVIKRQVKQEYKHVFIVNGATGGCVIALRAFKQQGFTMCMTRKAPYYVRYPKMIEATGLKHISDKKDGWEDCLEVHLVDMPSNPLGLMTDIYPEYHESPVILDAVYLNNVYMNPIQVTTIPHDVMVGSYSKLLGINGIRLGWLATNDDLLAARFTELITSEYCGLSTASQEIIKSALTDLRWDMFESYARFKMDINREAWSKLEKFFGDKPVSNNGMFYYAPMDQKCQDLLTKAGVNWTKGSAMGTDDSFGRINLGQDNKTVGDAVKAILAEDKI